MNSALVFSLSLEFQRLTIVVPRRVQIKLEIQYMNKSGRLCIHGVVLFQWCLFETIKNKNYSLITIFLR